MAVSTKAGVQLELDALQARLRDCRRCSAAGYAVEGPPIFSGPASASMMIVGQAPARGDADRGNLPWSGPGGRRLMAWLAEAGFEEAALRREQYMGALTRCYPGKHPSGKGDRVPSLVEQRLCAPWMAGELALVQPRVVVAVGKMAITRFMGNLPLEQIVGRLFAADPRALARFDASVPADTLILPLPHPSGASLWLNHAANQRLVRAALGKLSELRMRLEL